MSDDRKRVDAALKRAMKLADLGENTQLAYSRWAQEFLTGLRKPPRRATRVDAERFLETLVDRELSAASRIQALAAIRFLFRDALRLPDPTASLHRPKNPERLPKYLTEAESMALLQHLEGATLRAARLMLGCGHRISESLKLRVRDLEPGCRSGWVRGGKGRRDRRFEVPASLAKELTLTVRKMNPDDFIVGGRRETPLSVDTIQKALAEAASDAGIKKHVHPHLLRHTFATRLLEKGVDIRTIQVLLGHKRLDTTQIYAGVTDVVVKRARGAIDSLL